MLTNNLTTLVLNLLISERLSHRLEIAGKITEILDTHADENWKIEEIIRRQFTSLLMSCTENPVSEQRIALRMIASIYKEFFVEPVAELAMAA